MSAIRPGLPSLTPQPNAEPARARTAQAAFFRAALDQTQAVQAASRPSPPVAPAGPTASQTPLSETPARPLRPGSLLDIKV